MSQSLNVSENTYKHSDYVEDKENEEPIEMDHITRRQVPFETYDPRD